MAGLVRTSRNAALLFFGNLLRMVLMFLFFWYAANALGVKRFGQYSLVIHYFELLTSLSAAAAGNLLIREIARNPQMRDEWFTSAAILVSALAVLLPLVLMPILVPFEYSSETMLGIGIACLGLIPAAISVLYEEAFVAHERAEFVTLGMVAECLLRVGLSIFLIWKGFGLLALSLVMVFTRLSLVALYRHLIQKISPHHWSLKRSALREFFGSWRVFVVENWMFTVYTNLDVIILSSMLGEAAVGLYSAAWRYVRLGATAAKSFTRAAFPLLTRLHVDSQGDFDLVFKRSVLAMCMVALPIIAVVTVIPERVVSLIFKPEYAGSAPILRILIWVLLFEFLNPFLSFTLFSQGKQRCSMYVAAIGLLVCPIALILFIRQFGAVGGAIAMVLCGLIATSTYLSFLLKPAEWLSLAFDFFRIAAAAIGLAVAIHFAAEQSWIAIAALSILVYGLLLIVFGTIPFKNLQALGHQFLNRATT